MARKTLRVVVALAAMMLPLVVVVPGAQADDAGDLLAMVNNLRSSAGRPPLVADPALTAAAQKWTAQMAANGAVANANLASLVPAGWTKLGENVASGGSAIAIFNTWRDAPDHNALMVDPAFTLTGVAVVTSSDGITVYVSEFLEARRAASTTTTTRATTTTTRPTTTTTTTATTTTTTTTVPTTTTVSPATTTTTAGVGTNGVAGSSSSTTVAPGSGSGSGIDLGPAKNTNYRSAPWVFAIAAAAVAMLCLIGAGVGGGRQPAR